MTFRICITDVLTDELMHELVNMSPFPHTIMARTVSTKA
jgi:hypothetical protein